MTISVEVPNPDPQAAPSINALTDVQFVNISYQYQPEKFSLKVFNFNKTFSIKM